MAKEVEAIAKHTIHRQPDPKKDVIVILPGTKFSAPSEEMERLRTLGALMPDDSKPVRLAELTGAKTQTQAEIDAATPPAVKQQADKKWSVVRGEEVLVADLDTKKAAETWIVENATKKVDGAAGAGTGDELV